MNILPLLQKYMEMKNVDERLCESIALTDQITFIE